MFEELFKILREAAQVHGEFEFMPSQQLKRTFISKDRKVEAFYTDFVREGKDIYQEIDEATRNEFPTQQEVADYLAQWFPNEESAESKLFADKWGLYSANPKGIVQKIMLATTPTRKVFTYARNQGYGLLITHHNTEFKDKGQMGQIIYHSTMDSSNYGHQPYFAKKMGLKNVRKLHDIVYMGELYKPLTLDEFKDYLEKHSFKIGGKIYVNQDIGDGLIRTVVYCSGGGGLLVGQNEVSKEIMDVSGVDADVYVTGQMYEQGIKGMKFKYVVELGHTNSEQPLFKDIKVKLQNRWANVQIDIADKAIDKFEGEVGDYGKYPVADQEERQRGE